MSSDMEALESMGPLTKILLIIIVLLLYPLHVFIKRVFDSDWIHYPVEALLAFLAVFLMAKISSMEKKRKGDH